MLRPTDATLIDKEIRALVMALNEAGIETDWCCSGEPGHMLIRPTIQARMAWGVSIDTEKQTIERVMSEFGIKNYWLLLNFAHGAYNTHGGESTWLIMIPGRFDLQTALPVAYSAAYQTVEDIDTEYRCEFSPR